MRGLARLTTCSRPSSVEHINTDGHEAIPLRQIADTLKRRVQCSLVTQDGHGIAVCFALATDGIAQLARLEYDVQDALDQQQSDAFITARNAAETRRSRVDLANQALRPGSQVALEHPSHIGDRRHYRDGRVTTLTGELLWSRK